MDTILKLEDFSYFGYIHYVLRAWKSFDDTTCCQTPIFKSQIIVGNGFWSQTNQLSTPLLVILTKNYFRLQKSSKKLEVLMIFEILCQYMCINTTSSEKFDCRTSRICEKIGCFTLKPSLEPIWQVSEILSKNMRRSDFPQYLVFQKRKVAHEKII